ncbi:MAG: primosomal protein N' [candidate division WS1 bacterium]|nr:primosomal protein N' [candidate division WS1 bacterium]
MPQYAEVMVDQPGARLDRTFTYSLPERLAGRVSVGAQVRVPLGKRRLAGYVVALTDDKPPFPLRDLEGLLVEEPLFGPGEVELARRIAKTYVCDLAAALRLFLPAGAARKPEQMVRLTPAGQEALEDSRRRLSPRARELLQALAQSGEMTAEQLAAQVGLKSLGGRLPNLEVQGLVKIDRRLRRPAASQQLRQWARLTVSAEQAEAEAEARAHRAPQQANTLRRLAAGEAPVSVLTRSAATALAKQGLVEIYERHLERRPEPADLNLAAEKHVLTPAQQAALDRTTRALEEQRYWGGLLHGVTGSGKTEVYLHAVEAALRQGRSAIVLTPEISLTPQVVERFTRRFGELVALLHSSLSLGERYDEWERVRRGEARVVVGARSALFAPARDLGIIIVDEEHEPSYKQDSTPRYPAVTVAQWRAEAAGAVLLLGSATPALERYHAAVNPEDSSLELLELPERIGNRPLPQVRTIDLRGQPALGEGTTFAEEMRVGLEEKLARGEQVMLFLNRRGFSTFVICRDCGDVLRCPNCAVSLTYHHGRKRMVCHHCDFARAVPDQCEKCEGYDIGFHGLGTERIADQVERQFPDTRVLRLDRDTARHHGSYGRILGQFARGEAQVLIGTQMIAKGHDFPEVTFVGVINADVGLHRPDFRAAERTFQLLTQVSGRAGRANKPGEVYVQTYNPDHPALQAAAEHDYARFYAKEIAHRRENQYPPFARLANLVFSHVKEPTALQAAIQAAQLLSKMAAEPGRNLQVLGEASCPLHKLRGRYRYQVLLKAECDEELGKIIGELDRSLELPAGVNMVVDVDPYDMM